MPFAPTKLRKKPGDLSLPGYTLNQKRQKVTQKSYGSRYQAAVMCRLFIRCAGLRLEGYGGQAHDGLKCLPGSAVRKA
jgi:hypothetical protein